MIGRKSALAYPIDTVARCEQSSTQTVLWADKAYS